MTTETANRVWRAFSVAEKYSGGFRVVFDFEGTPGIFVITDDDGDEDGDVYVAHVVGDDYTFTRMEDD